ncbi:Gfo/Idh/MocA family oxidoreductase [Chloroflexi bacterium TSY]|nr:Gfo/Idh/MocA family oxidoreductase [Chloroflexi bacterium TSY]
MAVIGPGRMGQIYARAINELTTTRLVAIGGRSEASTMTLAESMGVPGYAGSRYRDMLEAHPNIEAVVVATSEWAHLDPVLACLDAGKHVALEKPMATSPDDARQMVQSADEAGVKFMICHSIRFDPRYALMQQRIAKGELGELLTLHGRRHPGPRAVDRVFGKFPLSYWLIVHDIDMMLWTTDSSVKSVRAYSRSGGQSRHDFIIATLAFANGAVGLIECSWGSPPQAGRPQNETFVVRGTAGVAEIFGNEHGLVCYAADGSLAYPDTVHSPIVQGQQVGSFRSVIRHFAGAVRNEWPLLMTGHDGLTVIQVAAAIDQSLQENREIFL